MMNKTEVVNCVSEITAIEAATCRKVLDALDHVSGSVLAARFKGTQLDESAAVAEIAAGTNVPEEDCKRILAAFEQTFGEGLNQKFRFFRRDK